MKSKHTLLVIFFALTLSVQAQDYSVVNSKLKDLHTLFKSKLVQYLEAKVKLESPTNIADLDFDTNKQKNEVNTLYNELANICNQQNSLKAAFKGALKEADMDNDFPNNACKSYEEKTRPVSKSFINDNLTYLNGYNFDFNNSNASSGYMGNLNLFFAIDKADKISPWAINAGLKKINYAFADSKFSEYRKENILIKPLDVVDNNGDQYFKEFNQYTTTSKISSFSGYFQLLGKVSKNIHNLYLHTHIELQISKVDFNTVRTNIQQETHTVAVEEPIPELKTGLETNANLTNTYFGYYAGVGITGDFKIIESDNYTLRYFVQETMGYANIKLGNSKLIETEAKYYNNNVNFIGNFYSSKHAFHLLNTYVSNKINGLNILIGAEIRGVFDTPPLYIFYVGVNTDLQKIGGLFK